MHRDNKHQGYYNFRNLEEAHPPLSDFTFINARQNITIDFANPKAVKALNTALIKLDYKVSFWEFPDGNLCPGIPGRADYIHLLNDLFRISKIDTSISVLDIGTGASCVYPLIGNAAYKWKFVGSESNKDAIASAEKIITENNLKSEIELRHQSDVNHIFENIIQNTDKFDASLCNPPFYKSEEEALNATEKKLKGLGKAIDKTTRNFSGTANELWYIGGEKAFLHTYLYESSLYPTQCFWFTALVSNKDNVKSMYTSLKKLGATSIRTLEMVQGNKKSRVVAWTFLNKEEQAEWTNNEN